MFSPNFLSLTINSTLVDLPCHNFRVEASTLTQVVENEFLDHPELPGVFVTEKSAVMGVISRRKFFEQISQEYSRDIYLKRPIRVLVNVLEYQALKIPSNCNIEQAVIQALNRPPELLYEPIVVVSEKGEGILDLHLLILAQSEIFSQINAIIRKQEENTRQYAESLKIEQEKVQEYASELELKQFELSQRNQILEQQKEQLSEQTQTLFLQKQQISELNQRFAKIGHLLSEEGKKTFEEMLKGVNAICKSTEEIMGIGETFREELKAVDKATQSIDQISKKMEFLSLKASFLACHFQSGKAQEGEGLDLITSEIKTLNDKTKTANTQVNKIASGFKNKIQELRDAAHISQEVARSLVESSRQTQEAIAQLEELLQKSVISNGR